MKNLVSKLLRIESEIMEVRNELIKDENKYATEFDGELLNTIEKIGFALEDLESVFEEN